MGLKPSYFAKQAQQAQTHGDFQRAARLWADHDAALAEQEKLRRTARYQSIERLCAHARQHQQGRNP